MPSEERMKILRMLQDGKISAEDAAELITILEESSSRRTPPPAGQVVPPPPLPPPAPRDNRWFRVRVTDTNTGKTRVNVRMPIGMVSAGLKMGMRFAPEVQGMDLEEFRGFIETGTIGQIVDVYDEDDGEHVEVFIE